MSSIILAVMVAIIGVTVLALVINKDVTDLFSTVCAIIAITAIVALLVAFFCGSIWLAIFAIKALVGVFA